MRYICLDCDLDFDESDGLIEHREVHTELEECRTEYIYELRCPYCGAEEYRLEEYSGDES